MMFTEKYRPYYLADLVGQVKQRNQVGAWLRSVEDMPRSIMIQGPYTAGKTTIARVMARALLCKEPIDGEACGKCGSCSRFDKGNHIAYHEVNAGSDRGIDAMRRLAKIACMKVLGSKRRVIVLDEAQEITKAAWSAILKPIEEPPSHVIFLIVTTHPEKILDTIRSRCSPLKMSAISTEECTELLTRVSKDVGLGKAGIKKEHLQKVVMATGARPRNALHCLDQVYSLVKDNKGDVTSALVNSYIKDVVETDVEFTAGNITRDILRGQVGPALRRAQGFFEDADKLLGSIHNLTNMAMMTSISPKLLDPYYAEVLKDLDMLTMKKVSCRQAVVAMNRIVTEAVVECSSKSVPARDIIFLMIAEAGLLCKVYLNKNKPKEAEKPAE